MFSIIIPTLNEEHYLPKLLNSLTLQTVKNFEIIVVDGKSVDNTISIVKQYHKQIPKLRFIQSQKANLSLQRNLGARFAQGKWLIFVDADSVLLPSCINTIANHLRSNKTTVMTSWTKSDSDVFIDYFIAWFQNIVLFIGTLINMYISPGSLTIIRASTFRAIGGYDGTHEYAEDINLSQRLMQQGVKLTLLRRPLYIQSLRRFRNKGYLKILTTYAITLFSSFITKQTPKVYHGYTMGGHNYK